MALFRHLFKFWRVKYSMTTAHSGKAMEDFSLQGGAFNNKKECDSDKHYTAGSTAQQCQA